MKITKRNNWRVVLEPQLPGNVADYVIEPDEDKRNEKYRRLCDDIVSDVRRHVNDVSNVFTECDTEEVCQHCGYKWEEDESSGEPLCCGKAVEEFHEKEEVTP